MSPAARSPLPPAQPVDARARFLREITDRVPVARITELYLFPPMRQGGLETGVAVIALGAEDGDSTRQTVYTATYRLTLKGADRGKWEATMQADADAPLLTVNAVVRGVQRRSGDEMEPERLTAVDLSGYATAEGIG